eukprot:CAMPEP_0206195196 /NCGR_PEP_ID=MMETSP0166-20121206/7684_1 /ASSEMBLY_ACC=CAM_ASM_000260 /TAXON_ID=95228 /ORGANISM="Vannella robusta, Strain DIVA3 518/3/11/1/6" /LENGTH=201 /DNA_ID=CAMNT_0053612385 /DNA_START=34 /DNA_END=639 /DNA_ORIENTATION=+
MIYKVVMLGGGGVGKSAITIQFVQNTFVSEYDPTIENSYRRQFTVNDEEIMLDILDTAGQEEFAAIRDSHIREGLGFIIVYSVTSKESFKEVTGIRDRVLKVKDKNSYPMILLGNKCDLVKDRVVDSADGKSLADGFGIPFKECSARNRVNIDESFDEIIQIILKAKADGLYGSSAQPTSGGNFVPDLSNSGKSKKSCNLL